MNRKNMILVMMLSASIGMQAAEKPTRWVDSFSQRLQGCCNYAQRLNPFAHHKANELRGRIEDFIKSNDAQGNKMKKDFDESYNPWLFRASRILFATSAVSAVTAGATKYNAGSDKVVYGAAATSLMSLVSGLYFHRAAQKNFDSVQNAVDKYDE